MLGRSPLVRAVALLVALVARAAPVHAGEPLPTAPGHESSRSDAEVQSPAEIVGGTGAGPAASARRPRSSPTVPGLGARLLTELRRHGPDHPVRFVARGLAREDVARAGGITTAELGPILTGVAPGRALVELAAHADLIDAPKPLRPLLDVSRVEVGADDPDRGRDLPARYRGEGVLVAAYDTGLDLGHPDLRRVGAETRVVALWDQTIDGTPPAGHTHGFLCDTSMLETDTCPTRDPLGHGTHVLSIAASNGPRYRGIAPEADLVVARSNDFEMLLETLDWFHEVALARAEPMVVNLSLGGHEGPHDGTSLEAQAIDAYPHLVVAAAGNEGTTAVHARAELPGNAVRDVVLRFPPYPDPRDLGAVVDVWIDVGAPVFLTVMIVQPGGAVLARTSTVGLGDRGRTEILAITDDVTLGEVDLDPEATPSPLNGKTHVRVEVHMKAWQDAPAGPGFVVVRLGGEGGADLWVDTPPTQESLVSFDRDGALGISTEVTADVARSVSDLATAATALAVSAYVSRTSFPSPKGDVMTVSGARGELAAFSSFGPSLAPERTGPKPDIAAPGFVIIGARSRDTPLTDPGLVSALYRASAGTSMAAPHVAGAAALVLQARPAETKQAVKAVLVGAAIADGASDPARDPRWGRGRLDAARAIRLELGIDEGCACTSTGALVGGRIPAGALSIALVTVLVGSLRARRPRVTQRRCTPGIATRGGPAS